MTSTWRGSLGELVAVANRALGGVAGDRLPEETAVTWPESKRPEEVKRQVRGMESPQGTI